MTRINRISIHGFKSFAYKTDIPFEEKYNVILGPNGSGKSNIGDALCFVLGRLSAKSMRAEKAANLIFNGAKNKKPAEKASVEIAFDNSSKLFPHADKEVVINRTIKEDGGSVYRINGEKRTRTEVLDFLATAKINPDGYNIILQGDITRFVDLPPQERRKVIEEISDVTIYEEKKHKAMLELQKVDEQLNNAQIILKERGTYLRELKKDRDQALKFKELKDKIDSNKATILHLQMEEKGKEAAQLQGQITQHQEKIKSAEEKVAQFKSQIEAHRQNIAGINQEIEQKGEKEQIRVHKDIEDLKVSVTKEKARMSTLKDELNKIQQRRDQFKQEMQELQDKASSYVQKQKDMQEQRKQKEKDLQQLEQSIAQFKKQHKIESSQDLDKELEEKDKVIEQKQEEVQGMRQKQQELLRDKDKLEFQLQSIDERIKKVREVEQQNQEQLNVLQKHKNEFKAATLRLNQLLDQDSSFASQMGNARKKSAELQELAAKLNAKAVSIQASASGSQAVKSILESKKFKGVHGTIAQLGQVNKKFSPALEAAAGNRTQHLVVEDDATAAECIKFLKNSKSGTASFIPLNKIRSQSVSAEDKKLLKQKGAHDFAINLVTFKPKFQKAFEFVFGNTLVVEDIDVARDIGVGRIKMATLDGNISESSGVMRGGYMLQRHASGFAEKDTLEELEKTEKEAEQAQSIISNIEHKRAANEQELQALRTARAEREGEIIKLEKALHLDTSDLEATGELKKELHAQLNAVDKELSDVQKNLGGINRLLADAKTSKQQLRTQVNELRNPRLMAQLTAFEESRQKAREDVLRLDADLKNLATQIQDMLAPEQEKIKEIGKQQDKEEAQFTAELKELSQKVHVGEKELEQKEKASKEFYSAYRELFNKREKLSTDVNKCENDIEGLRERARTHERELNLISLKNAELKAKLAGLEEQFSKYKEVPLLKEKSVPEIQSEISKFEVMLGQMSAVNMKALEVYEQIESEYNKLTEKKGGLEKEKTDVLTLMNEIETKKKDHFMKTFTEVNKNFQRIFESLFKKGKAALQLDNEKQPFEDGLSIKVKLTGNRFMDIKSLSGGEKTLTALSFIFAIQEYQPASFYILDEIDAALDKHNSETLSRLIRSYADKAQYIVISHNDSVISEADTLYGISMNDGVSKVTSLKI